MIRRITTGFVSIALDRASEVIGPWRSAMCSRTWSTPDSWLLRFMQPNMLHDLAAVKARGLRSGPPGVALRPMRRGAIDTWTERALVT